MAGAMRRCQRNETPVTGSAVSGSKPLKIGDIDVATPGFLAPMSGVTDSPVRKLVAELGAGLVVSEMTASDELANGHHMSRLRCEATGIGPHVVQLAGCETHWMAEGGQIGRRRNGRAAEATPSLETQLHYVRTLYEGVCGLYGLRIGLRHARKHLGWALDVAADASRAPAEKLKSWRQKILTSEDPRLVR